MQAASPFVEVAQFGHVSQDGRNGRGADALERSHEARFARERLAGFDMRRDLGLKRRQGFAKAGDMRFKASADAGVAGMLKPVPDYAVASAKRPM